MTIPRSTVRLVPALAAALMLAITGCSTRIGAPGTEMDFVQIYPRVTASEGLTSHLLYQSENAERRNGLLDVVVNCRWSGREQAFFEYRFFWLDETSRKLNPDAAWRRVNTMGGTSVQFAGNATNEAAVDWLLEIRRGLN